VIELKFQIIYLVFCKSWCYKLQITLCFLYILVLDSFHRTTFVLIYSFFFFKCSHFIYLSVWRVKLMLHFFTIPCVLILEITNHLNLVFLYTLFLHLLRYTTPILTFSCFFLKCFHLFFFNVMSWCYKSSHLVFCVWHNSHFEFLSNNFTLGLSHLSKPHEICSNFFAFFSWCFISPHAIYIIPYNLMELSTQRINIAICGVNMCILFSPYAWNI
jgi:hypothetical protein